MERGDVGEKITVFFSLRTTVVLCILQRDLNNRKVAETHVHYSFQNSANTEDSIVPLYHAHTSTSKIHPPLPSLLSHDLNRCALYLEFLLPLHLRERGPLGEDAFEERHANSVLLRDDAVESAFEVAVSTWE